jgi:recombination protein RecT
MNEQTKPGAPGTALASPALPKNSYLPLREVKTLDDAFRNLEFMDRIRACVPDHVKPERMMRTFNMATTTSPGLRDASLKSFLGACLTTSQLGLEPNTPLGHSYLIPFKVNKWNPKTRENEYLRTDITFIPGYQGLMDLSYRTGKVVSIHADVVWTQDLIAKPVPRFSYEYGSDAHLRHSPLYVPVDPEAENEKPVFAYVHAKLSDGQAFLVWPWEQVERIRGMSQGYRAALALHDKAVAEGWRMPKGWTEAPWVKHRNAMAKKTMIRGISNMLPRSIELASMVQLDHVQDRKSITWDAVLDAKTIDGHEDYIGAAVETAEQQDEGIDDGRTGDAGATFTDRREQTGGESGNAKDQPPPGSTGGSTGAPTGQTTPPVVSTVTGGPSWDGPGPFEAALVTWDGEVGPTITDRVTFATAFLKLWQAATSQMEVDDVLMHNEASIDDASQDKEASAILAPVHVPRTFTTPKAAESNPHAFTVVEVPKDARGKLAWASWAGNLKKVLAGLPPQHMEEWLAAQRENIRLSPIGQRAPVITAVAMTFSGANITPPEWLASMQPAPKEKPKPAAADGESKPQGQLPVEEPDEHQVWATDMMAKINSAASLIGLNSYKPLPDVRARMVWLREHRTALFDQIQQAFVDKEKALKAEPPPGDEGDPGPENAQ